MYLKTASDGIKVNFRDIELRPAHFIDYLKVINGQPLSKRKPSEIEEDHKAKYAFMSDTIFADDYYDLLFAALDMPFASKIKVKQGMEWLSQDVEYLKEHPEEVRYLAQVAKFDIYKKNYLQIEFSKKRSNLNLTLNFKQKAKIIRATTIVLDSELETLFKSQKFASYYDKIRAVYHPKEEPLEEKFNI